MTFMSRLATGVVATVALGFLGTLAAPAASAEPGPAIAYDLRGDSGDGGGGGGGDLLGLGGLLDGLLGQDGLLGGLLNDVGDLLNGLL